MVKPVKWPPRHPFPRSISRNFVILSMDTLLLFQPSIFQRDGDFTFLPKLYLINLKGYQI